MPVFTIMGVTRRRKVAKKRACQFGRNKRTGACLKAKRRRH